MIAGTLEIQMAANLVRLQQDMNAAKNMVGTTMKSIESSVALAKSALGALGIGLGVHYFAGMVESSISAMEKLADLSKTTRITVEDLSGLKLAAKQSGSDLESIASSINKLGQNIGKNPEKFKALGITAKEPLEAFKQLADILNLLEDPQQRAAVAAASLGKSWQGAAPLLAEGSKKITEMVEKGKLLSGVTKEMAQEADEFHDRLAELNTTLEGSRNKVIGPLLPQLNDVAAAMGEAAKEGGALLAVWVGLGGAMTVLLGELRKLMGLPTDELSAVTSDVKGLEKTLASFSSSVHPAVRARYEEMLRVAKARMELLQHEKQLASEKKSDEEGVDPKAAAAAAARAAKFLQDQKAGAAAYADLLKDRAKNELEVLKDSLDHQQQVLDLRHGDFLIGDRDYYAQKLALAKQASDGEMKVLDTLLAEQQKALKETTSGTAEYYKALKEVEDTQAKQAKVTREFGQLTEITFLQAVRAADSYKRSIESVNIQILQLTGETAKAAALQYELQNRNLRKQAAANGDTAGVAAIDRLGQLTAAQASFTEQREKLGEVNARLAIQEERVENSMRTGSISELESMRQIGSARQDAIRQQEAIVENLQKIAKESQNPALVLQAEQAAAALAKLRSESDLLGQKFDTIFTSAAGEELGNFISRTKTAEQAFKDFGTTVVQQINRMVSEALAKRFFETISGGSGASGTGGFGSMLAKLLGGSATPAASNTAFGSTSFAEAFAGGVIPMAEGGDFIVTKPTLFLAGEAGRERATFSGGGRGGAPGQSITVHNVFQVTGQMDRRSQVQIAAAAGEGVQRALGRNG